jgi:hypothetical protein
MPIPSKTAIPPEAGYPGLPIDDSTADGAEAARYLKEEVQPRREFDPDMDGGKGGYRKVEFGKPGGDRFDPFRTGPEALTEFGLGVAMYFQTLRLLCVVFFCCGLMNAQAISYYRSEAYSDKQLIDPISGKPVPGMLRGSAICTRNDVVCLDAECNAIDRANLCHMGQLQAWFDLSMTIMLLILMGLVSVAQNKTSAQLDEGIQTAQDYSIIVDDPKEGDNDPAEWRDFFGQFGHVTFVTIAKDNGPLLKAMAERRAVMREIIMIIGNGTPSSEEDDDGVLDTTWDGMGFKDKIHQAEVPDAADPKAKRRALIASTGAFGMKKMEKWVAGLAKANEKLQAALDINSVTPFKPSKVFITFETELAQRRCLKALTKGTITAALDLGKDKMDPAYIFHDNVLGVLEAPEPSEVFWEDVQVTFKTRVKQQTITFFITTLMVLGSVFACKMLQVGTGPAVAALWITITNMVIPIVLKGLVTGVEDHVSLNSQQLSLFLKLTFFRWMNTAIVTYLITNFDEFLTVLAMKQVQAVIFADAVTTPILRTFNPSDLINHIIIAPNAPTQEKMNQYFMGTPWMAAERYADMTKTLFLALFYSALFPAGLFLTCLGFGFQFVVDKYSLLRSWRTPAALDDDITKISRGHLVFGVYCHAVMTMVFYAEFPFDNVCLPEGDEQRLEWWRYRDAKAAYNVTTDVIYTNCDQTVTGRLFGIVFGADMTRDTMYGKQARVVKIYAYLVLALTALLFIVFFGKGVIMGIYHLFHGKYKADTEANDDHFTDCDIQAYIPIITHGSLAYPLIACDVRTFDEKYLDFSLPSKELYQVQSLYNKYELPGYSDDELNELFSSVTYYPPPGDYKDEPDPVKE